MPYAYLPVNAPTDPYLTDEDAIPNCYYMSIPRMKYHMYMYTDMTGTSK